MDIERAYKSIGHANACEPYLSNMIRALSVLEAAKYVKAHKRAYLAYLNEQRNKR